MEDGRRGVGGWKTEEEEKEGERWKRRSGRVKGGKNDPK